MAFAPTTNPFCWTGGQCIWGEINARNFCNDGIGERWYLVDMNFGGFDGWHLLTTQFCTTNPPGGGYYADYHCVGTFDPVGNNTFTLSSSGFCNMPSTITITPGDGTTYPCPC